MELILCRQVFLLFFLCLNVEASGTQQVSRHDSSDPLVKHLVYRLAEDVQQMKKDITTLQKDHKEDIKTLKNDCTEDITALETAHKKDITALEKKLSEKGSGCPKDFDAAFGGSCYHFVSTPVSWYEASNKCRKADAHLASVETQQEQQHLVSYIKNNLAQSAPYFGFWLSGTDVADEGTWIWASTGRAVRYSNFQPGEPNGKRVENFLHLNKQFGYRWNDARATQDRIGYVCETQAN